jgi:DNA-binding LacI/PurR family transcriptional regulator
MGVMAADLCIDVLKHGEMYKHRVILPTELIVRESCGATMQYEHSNSTTVG